jgi:glycosyltransferase involved in cell wall biosynthesis
MMDDPSLDAMRLYELMKWADVLFVEFAEMYAPLVAVMKMQLGVSTPLVIRLHRVELYEPFVQKVQWGQVDKMVFVAPQCEEKFRMWVDKDVESIIIPNGYNAELFKYQNRIYSNRIMLGGSASWKKGYYEAIEYMQELDDKWELTVIGSPRPPTGAEYLSNCRELAARKSLPVFFSDGLDRQVLAERMGDFDIVLSSSLEEGTHCTVAEGMLTGLYPMIRNWTGSDKMYPPECVFDTWSEYREKLEAWSALSLAEKMEKSEWARQWVMDRYPYRGQAEKLVDVLENV